jgi:NADPH-dependent 2,4-dienoyl-CoA reductase/sulfur reductase-like enzyme
MRTPTSPSLLHRPVVAAPRFELLRTLQLPAIDGTRLSTTAADADQAAQRALRAGYTDLLIIGNGIAGLIAAVEARGYAPDAEILIVTAQNHPTINTPALKQFGTGRLSVEQLLAFPPGSERRLRIGVLHLYVEQLDPSARHVRLETGHTIKYGRLLLATGARPIGLPSDCSGRDFDGVMTLHRLAEYLDLQRRLPAVSSAVVIGGGYHAAETALLLRQRRIQVTWLIRGRSLLPRLLDGSASDILLRHIRRSGVEVQLETEVAGIVGRIGTAVGVVTTDNRFIPGQLVLACTGAQPAIELARGAGLIPLHHPRDQYSGQAAASAGIPVDACLQTAVPDIFAAGDVAAVRDPQTGRYETRAQWYSAFQQGRLAAAALTGVPIPSGLDAGALGSFWHATQLGALNVVAAGAPMLSERDHPDNEVLAVGSSSFYHRIVVHHNRLIGYLAIGTRQPAGLAVKQLIDEQVNIREFKRQLLTDSFDARSVFTLHRLFAMRTAAQRKGA